MTDNPYPWKKDEDDIAFKTKLSVKKAYMKGEIGLSDAIPALILDFQMGRFEALKYLGL